MSLPAMKYAYTWRQKVKSVPHFRYKAVCTSNPGLNSSTCTTRIGRLTNFIGPGEAAEAAGHSDGEIPIAKALHKSSDALMSES